MRDAETDTQTENNHTMMETEVGVMAVTSQGTPRFACNHQKLIEARKDSPID